MSYSPAVASIVYTSVQDALSGIDQVSAATIRKAVAAEKSKQRPRTALITGLERELRRRAKGGKRAGSE